MGCDMLNKDYVQNVTCRLKATRDGSGRTTVSITVKKPTRDLWIEAKGFYKNSALKFLPFFNSFHYDLCKMAEGKENADFFAQFVFDEAKKVFPNFFNRCPWKGKIGFENVNLAEIMENALVDLIPKGTYRLTFRLHNKADNVTYGRFFTLGEVKALNALQDFYIM